MGWKQEWVPRGLGMRWYRLGTRCVTFEDVGFKKERQRGLMCGGLQSRQAGSESESACWSWQQPCQVVVGWDGSGHHGAWKARAQPLPGRMVEERGAQAGSEGPASGGGRLFH